GRSKQVGSDKTGNKKDPAGSDTTALLADLNHDVRQLKHRPLSQRRRTSQVEKEIGGLRGRERRSRFQGICHRVRHRHDEDQEGEGESGGGHPFSSDEKEAPGSEKADE